MGAKDSSVKYKKYELIAPDGGWGYMIAIAMVINMVTATAFLTCFGLLYDDFFIEIGMSSTTVTLLTGITTFFYAIAGFFTNSLLAFLSMRKLALLAAICFDFGVLGNAFAHSKWMFFISQGVLQGIGIGILYNISCTMLNDYFVKRRLLATGCAQTLIGVLSMLTPMFVKWSLEEYGYRGTLLLVTGISLHNILGAVLLQPVVWHMKKVEVTDGKEIQLLIVNEENRKADPKAIPVVKIIDNEENTTKVINDKIINLPPEAEKSRGLKNFFQSFMDIPLFKKLLVSCVLWGPALSIFLNGTYSLIIPQALYADGWDRDHVALALSLFGFGDLTMRVCFIIGSKLIAKLGSQETYLIGVIIGLVSRIGMQTSKSVIMRLIYITVIGTSNSCICVLIPLVIADAVSPEKFTAAMGLCMMMCGVSNLVLAPIVGAVRDLTNSYLTAFYILVSGFAMLVLFWIIELCYKRNKHKREQRREYLNRTRGNKANK